MEDEVLTKTLAANVECRTGRGVRENSRLLCLPSVTHAEGYATYRIARSNPTISTLTHNPSFTITKEDNKNKTNCCDPPKSVGVGMSVLVVVSHGRLGNKNNGESELVVSGETLIGKTIHCINFNMGDWALSSGHGRT